MHTYATPKAVEKFVALLNAPKSTIYIDTCFGKSDNEHHAIGLEFLLNQKDTILRCGKKIHVIHYVVNELKKKQKQGHSWAEDMLNTIFSNPEIFEVRQKSTIEKELDSTENCNFADEALRRIAIADASRGDCPVLLTADYACALAIGTNVYNSVIFILDWTTSTTPTVRRMTEFMDRYKGLYVMQSLANLFNTADVVLTGSALRSKELPMFLDMLKRTTVQGGKLPVYIHETALAKATNLPPLLQELMPYLHLVRKGSFTDDFSWIQANYTTRSTGRDVVLVGSCNALENLKTKLDSAKNFHMNRRSDNIRYYQIAPMGVLRGIQSLNRPIRKQNTVTVEDILSAADEALPEATTAPDIMKAAHKGNIRAMGVLSAMYEHGYAVRQSPTMALLWKERRDAIKALRKQFNPKKVQKNTSLLSRFKYFVENLDCYLKRTLTELVLIK